MHNCYVPPHGVLSMSPRTGDWIETHLCLPCHLCFHMPPRTGDWIETRISCHATTRPMSPRTGDWIETIWAEPGQGNRNVPRTGDWIETAGADLYYNSYNVSRTGDRIETFTPEQDAYTQGCSPLCRGLDRNEKEGLSISKYLMSPVRGTG